MDSFYKVLRKIQKKERNNGTLARVDETFYNDIHGYLDELKKQAINDPLSNVHSVLNEAQRIATEICERREHKITDAAVVNIHRSYHLFTGNPQFDLVDTTPLNLTPEEEKFYYSLIDTLKNHRQSISLEKLSDNVEDNSDVSDEIDETKLVETVPEKDDDVLNRLNEINNTKPLVETIPEKDDDVLNRLNEINNAKPLVEKREPIEKQIIKSQNKLENIDDNHNAFDTNKEEFYDFESKKIERDTELVTMLVYDEVDAIMGVDEKIYGPFRAQDLVTLPLVNAKIFFKNRKGRQVKI